MNKPASTYVIIAHFTESGDFFLKKGGKHQGTFPSVSHRRRFLKRESLNNENTFPNSKNTNKKSSFSQGHSNVAELHCNLTGQNTKQNLRQKKWLEKFHISQVDKTRWHLNPGEGRNKDPVLMAGWQRERERERWENSGKVKQMALAFDFPDGCPDWWAQWHRVVSLTCCLHRLPIRRSLSLSLVSQTLRPGTTRQPGHSGFSLLPLFTRYR